MMRIHDDDIYSMMYALSQTNLTAFCAHTPG